MWDIRRLWTPELQQGRTFSALGVTGEPEVGLLPWVSVPESRLSGGFREVLVLPTVGQPVSLARKQTGHSQCVAEEKEEWMRWSERHKPLLQLKVVTIVHQS